MLYTIHFCSFCVYENKYFYVCNECCWHTKIGIKQMKNQLKDCRVIVGLESRTNKNDYFHEIEVCIQTDVHERIMLNNAFTVL